MNNFQNKRSHGASNLSAFYSINSLVNIPPTNWEFLTIHGLTNWDALHHMQYPSLRREVPTVHHTIWVTLQLVLGYVVPTHAIDISSWRDEISCMGCYSCPYIIYSHGKKQSRNKLNLTGVVSTLSIIHIEYAVTCSIVHYIMFQSSSSIPQHSTSIGSKGGLLALVTLISKRTAGLYCSCARQWHPTYSAGWMTSKT